MSLNLRQIEVFRAVMLTGSISGAARLLYVSQPAISRLIRHTELRLGLRLFDRRGGSLRATPEAKRLYREVEDVYQGVQRVNDLAHDLVRNGIGALQIAATPSPGHSLVPEAVAEFRNRFPKVRLNLQILSIADIVDLIGTQRIDVGVGVYPVEHPNVRRQHLANSSIVCIMPQDHPLSGLAHITPADLRNVPLITYSEESPYGRLLRPFLAKVADQLHVSVQVRFTHVACSLALAGAGIALVDEFAVRNRNWPEIVVRPIAPKISMPLSVLTLAHDPVSTVADHFVDVLFEVTANMA